MPAKLPPARPRPAETETPLAGIRVVDFTHFIAGPYATMILADCGAEVIKIESAGDGDSFRSFAPFLGAEAVPFLWTNRNKKSVALDLKTPQGLALARRLVDRADVVVENFSTGVMAKFGLDYETVAKDRTDLIYCSISSYGRQGPYASRVGFDPVIQAESGFMSLNGEADGPAYRAGSSVIDVSTGMMAANAILAAIAARLRTGRGQYVETTMIATGINLLANFSLACLATGTSPTRSGNTSTQTSPVGAFETADGPIYLACANDRTFQRFARDVLQDPELADDPAYATTALRGKNAAALTARVAAHLKQGERAHWLGRMHATGVPGGAVRTVGEALDGPEIAELGLLSEIPHPRLGAIPNVGLPFRLAGTPLADPAAAPELGANTHEILASVLGCSDAELSDAAAQGAFGRRGATAGG